MLLILAFNRLERSGAASAGPVRTAHRAVSPSTRRWRSAVGRRLPRWRIQGLFEPAQTVEHHPLADPAANRLVDPPAPLDVGLQFGGQVDDALENALLVPGDECVQLRQGGAHDGAAALDQARIAAGALGGVRLAHDDLDEHVEAVHEPARRPAPRADGGEHEGGNRLGRLSEIEDSLISTITEIHFLPRITKKKPAIFITASF